ncbi:hypothetical protein SARC_12273 [Sphaeroforma arctica JP610]|uniref:Uncharacterized protein n=1 Tax=Sphaeroforma arctica JP610 TaxID=667725 RepID=A0A0L0FFF9_9EUKA|nr:hypothetical protein SARC_12273 [Sphaeroforma arctica JP610]KNC75196.1 hypothetical protein SARC_12273 [Sphaeroforma arctica JP610]|eukprot:XP_014149098.1 hypothetical protein SARC_12273 [Sphaeroforma arctica JP610]
MLPSQTYIDENGKKIHHSWRCTKIACEQQWAANTSARGRSRHLSYCPNLEMHQRLEYVYNSPHLNPPEAAQILYVGRKTAVAVNDDDEPVDPKDCTLPGLANLPMKEKDPKNPKRKTQTQSHIMMSNKAEIMNAAFPTCSGTLFMDGATVMMKLLTTAEVKSGDIVSPLPVGGINTKKHTLNGGKKIKEWNA